MKIAQISHLWESVPPKQYGGTERVISYLTEELVRLGHDVTLFASGDSTTAARLEAICPKALRFSEGGLFTRDAFLVLLLERVFGSAGQFDIIHSHLDFLGFPLARRCPTPVITTLHGKLGQPELKPIYWEYAELPLVSLSYAQRRPCPLANWKANIHHGLPRNTYKFRPTPGKYLAFLGRISPEKCPDAAIRLAERVTLPLHIAAKVDPVDDEYFHSTVAPFFSHPLIEYVGEISDEEKNDFLGNALAVVCPYQPEPFGLVLIEALACGTPVLTYHHGSFPEIIEDGVTGFLCRDLDEMIAAVDRLPQIDRAECRRAFEMRFTVERMAKDYLHVYKQVVSEAQGIEERLSW